MLCHTPIGRRLHRDNMIVSLYQRVCFVRDKRKMECNQYLECNFVRIALKLAVPDRKRSCPEHEISCDRHMQIANEMQEEMVELLLLRCMCASVRLHKEKIRTHSPAVSHIWSFTTDPPTLTIFEPNSTPMVCELSSLSANETMWRIEFQLPFSSTRIFSESAKIRNDRAARSSWWHICVRMHILTFTFDEMV